MDTSLKQRLIGAAVLVALAVIFLPMLVQGPAPDSGAADVPLSMPSTPDTGMETRELPLAGPADAPAGGATGMPSGDVAQAGDAPAQSFPAATAGGDYAVHFGSYASADAAQSVVLALQKAQLPGYSEAVQLNGKPAWRVRIGPFATQADAEAARLGATQVRGDVNARVVVLDAETATPAAATTPIADAARPAATPLPPAPPPAATTTTVAAMPPATAKADTPKPQAAPPAQTPPVKPAPAPPPAAANVGFAVQLAAFSKPADAEALRDRARAAGFDAFTESVKTDNGTLTRVRIGPVADRAAADQLKAQVQAKLGVAGIVRPHP